MNPIKEFLSRDYFGQLPRPASTLAPHVDWLYQFIFWFSVVAFVAIIGTMLYFAARYRGRGAKRSMAPTGNHLGLELGLTFAPLLLLVPLFHWGFEGYVDGVVAPPNAMEIRVRARKWLWEFELPNGSVEVGNLIVPANRPIKLVMSSDDVVHSFYVPEFRVKRDVVPGMYTTLWFEATEPGEYQVFCTEYCGTSHSGMLAKVRVVPAEDYERILEESDRPPQGQTVAQWGEALFRQNNCNTCHSVVAGGPQVPGPNLHGIAGHTQPLQDGTEVTVDLEYVRESILRPQAKIVRGYSAVQMPAFRLTDKRIEAIYSYLETLR
jgi:cytochrome c oxidase subunit 2